MEGVSSFTCRLKMMKHIIREELELELELELERLITAMVMSDKL